MKNFMLYFAGHYVASGPYMLKKSKHTITFVLIGLIYTVINIVADIIFGNAELSDLYLGLGVTVVYFTLLFIIKWGKLKLAVNIIIISGLVVLGDIYPLEMSIVFYSHILLSLLIVTSINMNRFQLYFIYTVMLSVAVFRAINIYFMVFPSYEIQQIYRYQSTVATLGILTFFMIILSYHYIVDEEIKSAMKLEEMIGKDYLTGLNNRRAFSNFVEYVSDEGKRINAIGLLDIDHFKKINDVYGHTIGDSCLKKVSEILTKEFKSDRAVYRWGGEEFLILFDTDQKNEIASKLENLRDVMKSVRFDIDIPLTFSAGIAVNGEANDIEHLISIADSRLYAAKDRGRDRTVVS